MDARTIDDACIDLVHQLHAAIYGDSWARPEPPAVVWQQLLEHVRALASGRCHVCVTKDEQRRNGGV